MNFNAITEEAQFEHGIIFWERTGRDGRISGYTVERRRDGLKASMLHTEGRTWKGAFGKDYQSLGTKAFVANWALDLLANAD